MGENPLKMSCHSERSEESSIIDKDLNGKRLPKQNRFFTAFRMTEISSYLNPLFKGAVGFFLVLFISTLNLFSSEILTLEKAIDISLKNNYSVTIARNQQIIADRNLNYGRAGFLPILDAYAAQTWNSDNLPPNSFPFNYFSAGINFNWTIFDGFKMFRNYDKLTELKDISDLDLRYRIENTALSVYDTYYSIIKEIFFENLYKETVELSQTRYNIYKDMYDVGKVSKLELIQSQVYLNEDKSKLYNQTTLVKNLKIVLNQILTRDINSDFEVSDTITYKNNLELKNLSDLVSKNNTELLISQKNKIISDLDINISKSNFMPKLGVFASFGYASTNNNYMIPSINKNLVYYGISLSYNIFNGFNNSNDLENSKVQSLNSELTYNDIKKKLESDLLRSYNEYKNNLELVNFEQQNVSISKENLDISNERLRLGTISYLELREAQLSFVSSKSRYINSIYNTKISEIELLKLSGQIF